MNDIKNNTPKKNALFAGIAYLLTAITGFYALMFALPQIKVEGDIVQTIANMNSNPFMFRAGIISMLCMNIITILLVIYLYKLLSNINKTTALSMLVLMLFGAGISTLNEVNHFAMLCINNIDGFSIEESQNLTILFSEIYNHGAHIAVIFWGLWLFPLGVLIYKLNTRISKFLGILLFIAGAGYILDSLFLFVYPHLNIATLSDYTSFGEILLMIWLLVKNKTIEGLAEKQIKKV
ncbi:DUF4386 domain-containing protein [Aquimarina spinulae]|uniref:DUF4386 domain-containing protein n=1 Tax=Aquimarina spinulae TaxID=1192023 RepID=UPI000D55B993|nr:DUF4386 domain-containing protein [Aquimarina spinulae]